MGECHAWPYPLTMGIVVGLWWQAALFVVSICALPFDSRTVVGLNPWIKPLKFELSVAILLATCGVLLDHLSTRERMIGWTLSIALGIETTLIALQALRGVRSHMNIATPFDRGVSGTMGICVLFILVALLALLVRYCTGDVSWPPALVWAARLGLVVLIAGSIEGFAMIARQQHTVGAADGAGGLPFINWSRSHGDLRVPHFFAIHALQAFLIAGALLSRTKLPYQPGIIWGFAVAYSAMCGWLFRAALLGRPLI